MAVRRHGALYFSSARRHRDGDRSVSVKALPGGMGRVPQANDQVERRLKWAFRGYESVSDTEEEP